MYNYARYIELTVNHISDRLKNHIHDIQIFFKSQLNIDIDF